VTSSTLSLNVGADASSDTGADTSGSGASTVALWQPVSNRSEHTDTNASDLFRGINTQDSFMTEAINDF
jgi:hypothetical protein